MELGVIGFAALAALSVGAIAYVFLFDRVQNENKRAARVEVIKTNGKFSAKKIKGDEADGSKRRKKVQDSLKQLEDKQKKGQKVTLKMTIAQAGLATSVPRFYVYSFLTGLFCFIMAFIFADNTYVTIAAFFIGMLGLPRWFLNRKRNKRIDSFTLEFPNAVDVIVRGVKAGLPLNDCISIVAREAKEPVAGEFRHVIEQQQLGVPMSKAIVSLYERMPTAEANFFGIVISIQQGAGGNLSEALANLSKVLRDRKMMKEKIKAMSSEAKASGMIIGSLPIVVALMVYFITPDYIMILFTDPTGNLILAAAAFLMSIGIFVMKQMINFDF